MNPLAGMPTFVADSWATELRLFYVCDADAPSGSSLMDSKMRGDCSTLSPLPSGS